MKYLKKNSVGSMISWITNSDKVGIGDIKKKSSKNGIVYGQFNVIPPLHQAAINYDHNLVKSLLEDSDDVTEEDICKTDTEGFTAFYCIMKNCPKNIGKLLFGYKLILETKPIVMK